MLSIHALGPRLGEANSCNDLSHQPTDWRWSAELVHVFRYHYAAFALTGFYNLTSSDNALYKYLNHSTCPKRTFLKSNDKKTKWRKLPTKSNIIQHFCNFSRQPTQHLSSFQLCLLLPFLRSPKTSKFQVQWILIRIDPRNQVLPPPGQTRLTLEALQGRQATGMGAQRIPATVLLIFVAGTQTQLGNYWEMAV